VHSVGDLTIRKQSVNRQRTVVSVSLASLFSVMFDILLLTYKLLLLLLSMGPSALAPDAPQP
jgi:hypothetical protein